MRVCVAPPKPHEAKTMMRSENVDEHNQKGNYLQSVIILRTTLWMCETLREGMQATEDWM